MAVPKRRMSRANTHSRRSQWKASPPDLEPVTVGGVVRRVPRRLLRAVERGLIDPGKL
ncbi:50S ribosomal protein L32 [Nocardia sp. NPDC056611]|uniref:50S ribosomal protein L32 n=1 Tax=Nocardia sp. NPDC056611 TaxID=3345877 RepID=UPI0036732CA0